MANDNESTKLRRRRGAEREVYVMVAFGQDEIDPIDAVRSGLSRAAFVRRAAQMIAARPRLAQLALEGKVP